jgi:hypothetical protein
VDQHLDQVAVGHDELGHEIDIVVAGGPQRLRRGLAGAKSLEELVEVEGGGLAAIVTVAVDVQDLEEGEEEEGRLIECRARCLAFGI